VEGGAAAAARGLAAVPGVVSFLAELFTARLPAAMKVEPPPPLPLPPY